jgi:hypothetical protein
VLPGSGGEVTDGGSRDLFELAFLHGRWSAISGERLLSRRLGAPQHPFYDGPHFEPRCCRLRNRLRKETEMSRAFVKEVDDAPSPLVERR